MGNLSIAIRSIPYTLLFSVSGYVFAGTFFASLIIFLIFFDVGSNEFPWYLGFAFHVSLELLLLGYVQKDKLWFKNIAFMRDSETIIEDMKSLAIIIGMAGLLNVLGLFDTIISFKNNVFSLAVSILYAGYMGIVFGMSSSLLFRLMTQRPHALSNKLTLWIIGLSGITLFLQLFFYTTLQVVIHITAGIIGLFGFYNTKGLQWFSEITKKQKTDLAWSSIVIVLSISIIAGNYQHITFVALNQIMSVAEPFIFAIGIWLLLIAGRLSIIAINSLPTAGLIDRKTLEFTALSELTAIASTTQNYQQILQSAVHLIEKAIEVRGLYGKICIQDGQFETYHGELGTELSIIHSNTEFISWKSEQSTIGNLFEIPESMDPHKLLRIQSIVSLIIQIDRNKYAEILLAHEEPYHFTPEDEIILSTFVDSLRIAIINASLLTIENEHQIDNRIPQADDPELMIEFLKIVNDGNESTSDIAVVASAEARHVTYYLTALAILGLVDSDEGAWQPTEEGIELLSREDIAFAMKGTILDAPLMISWMALETSAQKDAFLANHDLSGATISRRKVTLDAWVTWCEGISSAEG